MSTNIKNEYRNGFTRNFSNDIIERYIKFDNPEIQANEQDEIVNRINETLWEKIQEINMRVKGRRIPFVVVHRIVSLDKNTIRVIMYGRAPGAEPEYKNLDMSQFSHCAVFEKLGKRKIIKVLNPNEDGQAHMFVGYTDQIAAAVDIFLDIAMYNSYSFLKNESPENRKAINKKKANFYKNRDLYSYYEIDYSEPPTYFSFAFAARNSYSDINYDYYIAIWDMFVEKYYPNESHKCGSPHIQLKSHVDIKQIPQKYRSVDFWKDYPQGDYLFLMLNKKPNDTLQCKILKQYMRAKSFHGKVVNIVPLNDYFHPYWQQQFRELIVSAYKIVVCNHNEELVSNAENEAERIEKNSD